MALDLARSVLYKLTYAGDYYEQHLRPKSLIMYTETEIGVGLIRRADLILSHAFYWPDYTKTLA